METEQLIKDQLEKIPEAKRKAVLESSWAVDLKKIAVENGLSPEMTGPLETETLLVLLEVENKENFTENLVRELTISREVAGSINKSVSEKVFAPILESKITNEPVTPASKNEKLLEEPKEITPSTPQSFYNTHTEKQEKAEVIAPTPAKITSYPGGIDPYREPI